MDNIPYAHPAWIEIDTKQLRQNLRIMRQHIGEHPKLLFPVKANAYGHGLVPTAQHTADLVDYFGVSCLQEGALLREAGIHNPILVMGAIHAQQIPALAQYNLEVTISSLYKAKLLVEKGVQEQITDPIKVHLEIDSGMNRTGLRISTAPAVIDYIKGSPSLDLVGIYSHFATAATPGDPFFAEQSATFLQFLHQQRLIDDPSILCHFANSAAVACHPETHLDMVRPGLLSYGYYPREDLPNALREIKPCFAVKARVSYFKTIMMGHGVSYNHSYKAKKQSRILTIPLGYGDGYRRSLSNKSTVILKGKHYPVIGDICMDQFMVDIGDDSGYVGDVVTIIGKEQDASITMEQISDTCDTIPYEILCGFNERLPRIFT